MASQLLSGVALAEGAANRLSGPPPAVRRAMWEFNRFLDHHPLLETQLRLNPAASSDAAYVRRNREYEAFIKANPLVVWELKRHPRYFLYRALLRQSTVPMRYSDIARLRNVFDANPDLERALVRNPAAIRDPAFLQRQPLLRASLAENPLLGQEFLPRSQSFHRDILHDHPPASSHRELSRPSDHKDQ
jgi:hypothetical protein